MDGDTIQRIIEEIRDQEAATELGEFVCELDTVIDGLDDLDLAQVRAAQPETRERELRELNVAIGRLLAFRMEIQQHVDAA